LNQVVEFCNFTGLQLAPHKCVISANEEGWDELENRLIDIQNLDFPIFNLLKSMKVARFDESFRYLGHQIRADGSGDDYYM